jgi:hypothetical protein
MLVKEREYIAHVETSNEGEFKEHKFQSNETERRYQHTCVLKPDGEISMLVDTSIFSNFVKIKQAI